MLLHSECSLLILSSAHIERQIQELFSDSVSPAEVMDSKNQKGSTGQKSKLTSRLTLVGSKEGRGRPQEALYGAGTGPHLSLAHQTRLTSMRMKTINRKPTTAARPTSQGFRRRSEAAKGRKSQ